MYAIVLRSGPTGRAVTVRGRVSVLSVSSGRVGVAYLSQQLFHGEGRI